jgi:hypothetical protein
MLLARFGGGNILFLHALHEVMGLGTHLMVAKEINRNQLILDVFTELSTGGDNHVDNSGRPPKIPIFSSQAHDRSGPSGQFPG